MLPKQLPLVLVVMSFAYITMPKSALSLALMDLEGKGKEIGITKTGIDFSIERLLHWQWNIYAKKLVPRPTLFLLKACTPSLFLVLLLLGLILLTSLDRASWILPPFLNLQRWWLKKGNTNMCGVNASIPFGICFNLIAIDFLSPISPLVWYVAWIKEDMVCMAWLIYVFISGWKKKKLWKRETLVVVTCLSIMSVLLGKETSSSYLNLQSMSESTWP